MNQKLSKKAMELGASDARIIPADIISVEDKIIEMCKPPLCEGYGKSANCPPHVMAPSEAREWIKSYRTALLFKIDVLPLVLFLEKGIEAFKKVYLLSSLLETISIQQGYTISRGLAAGSCKHVFCRNMPCEALINGGKCRHPSFARPSMEALGINVFKLARDVGWKIHPILRNSDPKTIPEAMLAGLVLIG